MQTYYYVHAGCLMGHGNKIFSPVSRNDGTRSPGILMREKYTLYRQHIMQNSNKLEFTLLRTILRNEFYSIMVMEHIVPTFKQLYSLEAIGEFITSIHYYMNIQLPKYMTSSFDLRNILLSNQTNAT